MKGKLELLYSIHNHKLLFAEIYHNKNFLIISLIISIIICFLMEKILFAVIISLLLFIASFYFIYLSTRTLQLVTPGYLYFFFYTIYCYVWSLSVFIKGKNYSIGEISIKGYGYDLLLASTLGIFCFSLGVLIITAITRFRPYDEFSAFKKKEWVDDIKGIPFAFSITLLIFIGLSLSVVFFITRGVPILAYSHALGSAHFYGEMGAARIESQWGAGYFIQGITLILPFCIFILYAKGFVSSRKILKIATFLLSTLTIAMMISLTSRGHFAIFLVLLFLLHQMLAKQINWRKAFLFFMIFAVLFIGVSIFKMGYFLTLDNAMDFISDVLEIFFYRLSMGTQQFHAILQIFPAPYPFILGKGYIWDIVAFAPGPDMGFNAWVFTLIYPFGIEGSAVTPLSVGEFYANFGWPGIIIGSILIGIVLQFFYIKWIRSKGKLTHLVAFVVFSSYLAKSSMNGLGSILEPIISMTASYSLFVVMYHFFGNIFPKSR